MIIREMSLSDLEKIKDTLSTDFDDFWNYNIFKEELKNKYSKYFCAIEEIEIVGFAGVWKSIDIMHITNIVVKRNLRRRKIGEQLLEKLLEYSILKQAREITLEVHEDNIAAQKLYKKFGFKQVGVRKKYYKDKNGIILTLNLRKEENE